MPTKLDPYKAIIETRLAAYPQLSAVRLLAAALYRGGLVATRRNVVIPAFYRRVIAAGKPKKVALTACMRKLLTMLKAMMRTNTTWRQLDQPAFT